MPRRFGPYLPLRSPKRAYLRSQRAIPPLGTWLLSQTSRKEPQNSLQAQRPRTAPLEGCSGENSSGIRTTHGELSQN